MKYRHAACFILAVFGLTACSVGPDYVRPEVDVPAEFKEAGQWKAASAQEVIIDEAWWKIFGDPVLDELQAQVIINNQNLKVAEAQYRAARAALDSAKASYFPTISGSAGVTRGTGSSGGNGPVSNAYNLSGSLSWEIDIWGRIRRSVESADAKLAASAGDLAAARLSAQALLAQTYIQLRAAEIQQKKLQETVAAYSRFLTLTKNRFEAGVASPLDLNQAETQLASAQVQAIDTQNQRAQLEHAIAVLIGKPPAALTLPEIHALPAVPQTPDLIPSTLLERRPDIVAAERRMAAANAEIGVAKAAYFPVLDLTGGFGYRNNTLSDLISLPNRFWSLGPALAMTLFDGGARSAAVDQASAGYDQAVATYRQTVLSAFQEVEDNLSAARLLTQEAEMQAKALAAATRSREIAVNQYEAGINSALQVITAQSTELSAEITQISILSRRLQAAVQLLKNAGGPWSLPEKEPL